MDYHILPNGIPWYLAAWYTVIWHRQSLLWLVQTRWYRLRERRRLDQALRRLYTESEECAPDEAQS
jgi:hypothetical protein